MIITAEQALGLCIKNGPDVDEFTDEIYKEIADLSIGSQERILTYRFPKVMDLAYKNVIIAHLNSNNFKTKMSARFTFIEITW